MTGAKIDYTVKDDNDISVELMATSDDISLISTSVTKNASDYTLEIITSNHFTGKPSTLTVPSGLESSNDTPAMLMIIDWYTKLNGTGPKTLVKRRTTSTKVK